MTVTLQYHFMKMNLGSTVLRSFLALVFVFGGHANALDGETVHKGKDKKQDSALVSVTRVVGEVGEHRVVTSREVRLNDAIEQVMAEKAGEPGQTQILTGFDKTFATHVAQVLDEWVVYLEANSLSNQFAAKSEVARWYGVVQEKLGSLPAWKAMEPAEKEVRDIIERKLIAKDFQRLKSDPSLAPISDEEALSYYKKNRLRFGSLPFSSFKDNIKSFLVKQQTERRLKEWHEVLWRKYKVRNFIAG